MTSYINEKVARNLFVSKVSTTQIENSFLTHKLHSSIIWYTLIRWGKNQKPRYQVWFTADMNTWSQLCPRAKYFKRRFLLKFLIRNKKFQFSIHHWQIFFFTISGLFLSFVLVDGLYWTISAISERINLYLFYLRPETLRSVSRSVCD